MRRPSPFAIFVLSAFGWMLALTVLWTQISPWTSYPVGVLSSVTLEQTAPMWVREVHLRPGVMDVDTRVAIPVPSAGGRKAEVTIDVNPARYAYGLPIFLALLLVDGVRSCLLPPQDSFHQAEKSPSKPSVPKQSG